MTTELIGPAVRRLCAVVDVEGYSRHPSPVQVGLQRRLDVVLRSGLRRAGLTRWRTRRQDRGDGQLMLLPTGVDEARVVPGLVRGLLTALAGDRAAAGDAPVLRLRLALGQGIVHDAPTGYVGPAVVEVCRLVDSAASRTELSAAPDADLCLVVTDDLYRDVIVQGYGGLPGTGFREVRVRDPAKGFAATAWLRALTADGLGPDPAVVTTAVPLAGLAGLLAGHAAALAADHDRPDAEAPDPDPVEADPAAIDDGHANYYVADHYVVDHYVVDHYVADRPDGHPDASHDQQHATGHEHHGADGYDQWADEGY